MNALYSRELIKSSIDALASPRNFNQLRSCLPYCLVQQKPDCYLPLNRSYKPIGISERDWVEYNDYSFLFIPFKLLNLESSQLKELNSPLDLHHYIYFFDDKTHPRDKKLMERYKDLVTKTLKL